VLLLTHGWRKYNWEQITTYKFPAVIYPIESDISIQGKLTKPSGKAGSIATGRLDFITKTEDSITILSTVTPSALDGFVLSGLNFKKTASIYYQGINTKKEGAIVKVSITPSFFDSLQKSRNLPEVDLNPNNPNSKLTFTSYYEALINQKKELEKAEGKLLGEVVVRSRRLSLADSLSKIYVSGPFENSDQTIPTRQNSINIWRFLETNISGLRVGKDEFGETTVFFTRSFENNSSIPGLNVSDRTTNIDFYLNEIKVSKDMIEYINPEDFVLVKVWKGTSGSTIGSDRGAIVLYTDKTKSRSSWLNKGFDVFKKEGYSVSREFYSLDYSIISPQSAFLDFRPTLYWNPNLKPDKTGNAVIKFYNDDAAKKFKLVIQGIDEEGKIIIVQKILE
jgi:hypothetical protein